MRKLFSENITVQLIFLSLVVFLSRLPFLSAGFGAEEDSWLLPITAKNIALSGQYELSRAPGHPLQEIIYSLMWNAGLFAYNLLTAIASVIAVLFFALALRQLDFRHYLFASFAFAFTPIVFISSTYTIDYMLAMACVMGSFYFLLTWMRNSSSEPFALRQLILSGIMLGFSIGFRITSGAMLIPFCILFFPLSKGTAAVRIAIGREYSSRGIFILCITTVAIGILTYIPVVKTYEFSFFTFADQFPYPNLPKVFYIITFGVFGTIGIASIIFYKIKYLIDKISLKEKLLPAGMPVKLFLACLVTIAIYIIFYLRLPQKSAYFIPAIPFIILLFGYFLSSRAFKTFCVLMTMSSFLFSINLTDPLRGSEHSLFLVKFRIAGQEIFIDPLTGPVFSDYTKRLNKIAFTEEVFRKVKAEQRKTFLICGWWYNELKVRNWHSEENKNVVLVFYADKYSIEKYISRDYEIKYLPEQNIYNDQYSQMSYTDSVAKPYM
ncbi:MAG: hypothetical protein HY840_07205 [Bacteroidetes bacterium]|nr:hypothetical protein [Bacteroidota bacterium]